MYEDKMLICIDCSAEFNHFARDQEYYISREFDEPKRCKPCRIENKARRKLEEHNGSK